MADVPHRTPRSIAIDKGTKSAQREDPSKVVDGSTGLPTQISKQPSPKPSVSGSSGFKRGVTPFTLKGGK